MYRMIVRELGGPAALEREELSELSAAPGQVVIDVRAVGCNFFDILISEGRFNRSFRSRLVPKSQASFASLVTVSRVSRSETA